MSSRLADRLSAARRRHFVGRAAERDLFRTALHAPDLPFLLLYVSGPGGVGKSALVREFEAIARETGVPAYYLDGRNAEPTPDGFLALLHFILGIGPDENPAAALASRPGRHLLLIDLVNNYVAQIHRATRTTPWLAAPSSMFGFTYQYEFAYSS
ncbi:MAG: ATP-binding protein [Anaerolineales bacterium]|nr:ATP-binding protein [Anaerolineales bacterium]